MRLAFVIYHYFPFGGLQRDAMRIAKACQQHGHQIEFLVMRWEGARDTTIPVHFFPQTSWHNYKRYQKFASDVQGYIKLHTFDAVIGFNKIPGLDFYYAGDLCYAATLNQKPLHQYYEWLPRYRYLLEAEAAVADASSKTHLLLMNEQAKNDFQYYYKTSAERLHILPPGINPDRRWNAESQKIRNDMRKRFELTAEDKIILMVGSSFNTKGVDRSIKAFAALPLDLQQKSHLFVVGNGKPKAFMRLAQKLGVASRIRFILGSDEIPAFLFAADILLHPSYRENAGMAILEAIVAGLPVLTTANCGYARYVDEAQAGEVLPMPFQQEQLNRELASMLTSPHYQQWRKNGIQFGRDEDIYSLPERAMEIITKNK